MQNHTIQIKGLKIKLFKNLKQLPQIGLVQYFFLKPLKYFSYSPNPKCSNYPKHLNILPKLNKIYINCVSRRMGASGLENRELKWNELQTDSIRIVKKGELYKQSKYLKEWRKRTVMLVNEHVITFNPNKSPTVLVNMFEINHLQKQQADNSFLLKIHTKNAETIVFKAYEEKDRDEWFSFIKSEKIRVMKESYFSEGHTQVGEDDLNFYQFANHKL